MPSKTKGTTHDVDGVPYTVTPAKKGAPIVVFGTGVVSERERDTFRLKSSGVPLDDQIRQREKFESIRSAVHGRSDGASESSAK
eukprot:793392-Prymnesium_polylepis.1